MPSLDQAQKQALDFVKGLSLKQHVLLAGAAVVTVAVLAVFVHLIAKPDFKPLMTGMDPADAQALGQKLAAKNIAFEISADGRSISVPSSKLDVSRMELASDGMPRSGRLGFELFDKVNWGQTEFDEKVTYQRALEGELERSIQTLSGVESARVHLVLPTESVFLDRERSAKASVILKLRSGQLSPETQSAIARLVSGAVDNLAPDNVTVIDADTNRQFAGSRHKGFSGDRDLQEELSDRLLATLGPVVGSEHVKASVNVEYDSSTTEENSETYDPKSAVAVSTQRSEEQVGGALTGGVPGTSSNVPGNDNAKQIRETGDGTQFSRTESNTFAVNKVARHTLEPAGRIRRITAALLLDDAVDVKEESGKRLESRRKRTPEELKQIEELAKAAIGIDVNRGDTVTIQNLSFDVQQVEAPAKPTRLERVRVTLNDWSSLLRYAAILLLFLLAYALLLRPVKKQVMLALRGQLPGLTPASAPAAQATVALPEPAALPPEQQRVIAIKKQLAEKAKTEPVGTSRLVQAWLREGAKK